MSERRARTPDGRGDGRSRATTSPSVARGTRALWGIEPTVSVGMLRVDISGEEGSV
jgi:hypothetical protein